MYLLLNKGLLLLLNLDDLTTWHWVWKYNDSKYNCRFFFSFCRLWICRGIYDSFCNIRVIIGSYSRSLVKFCYWICIYLVYVYHFGDCDSDFIAYISWCSLAAIHIGGGMATRSSIHLQNFLCFACWHEVFVSIQKVDSIIRSISQWIHHTAAACFIFSNYPTAGMPISKHRRKSSGKNSFASHIPST